MKEKDYQIHKLQKQIDSDKKIVDEYKKMEQENVDFKKTRETIRDLQIEIKDL